MKCENCGMENGNSYRYCYNCGAKLNTEEAEGGGVAADPLFVYKDEEYERLLVRRRRVIIRVSLIVVVLLLLAGAACYVLAQMGLIRF